MDYNVLLFFCTPMKRRSPILPLFLSIIAFFLLNVYLLSALRVYTDSPLLGLCFWLLISLLSLSLIYAIRRIATRGMDAFFRFATHAFLILVAMELVSMLILIPGDAYRMAMHQPRSVLWVNFAAGMAAATLLIFIYGMFRGKYAYRVIDHTLFFDNLPAAFDGFRITQISDVHAGSFTRPAEVQRGIEMIKQQQSDLFVFTGDLVNNKATEIVPWIPLFSQIEAPYGKYSVLGNHDYGDYVRWDSPQNKQANLEQLKEYHAALGFHLLLDNHVPIQKDGQHIILAGVENWGLGFGERGDLKKALHHVHPTDFKILLSHDSSHWESQVKTWPVPVELTLAGHTHGMQFGLEALGIKWSPVKYRYAHWAGIKNENGRYLNINRGFGFIGFSGRIGIWPEITVITLKRTQTA